MNQVKRSECIRIFGFGTAVPAYRMDQVEVADRLASALTEYPDSKRWARRIFKQCGVETRYTCEPNLLEPVGICKYLYPSIPLADIPSTRDRMMLYKQEAIPLGLEAASKALSDSQVDASQITHLITVSCTGQFLPGLDAHIIQELGLHADVNRIPLQFQGCAAGLKAIGLSRQIVNGASSAVVLVVCVELCTLHVQPSVEREALFGASFFGDGAAACVIGTRDGDRIEQGTFRLGESRSVLLPDSFDSMVWEVGNHGFDLFLSTEIPKLLEAYIPAVLEDFLAGDRKPELWAIHPGGRGIVDKMQVLYELTDEQVCASRTILKNVGNLSSATILFVLEHMRKELHSASQTLNGIALAFGPGLTVELQRITYVPAA